MFQFLEVVGDESGEKDHAEAGKVEFEGVAPRHEDADDGGDDHADQGDEQETAQAGEVDFGDRAENGGGGEHCAGDAEGFEDEGGASGGGGELNDQR